MRITIGHSTVTISLSGRETYLWGRQHWKQSQLSGKKVSMTFTSQGVKSSISATPEELIGLGRHYLTGRRDFKRTHPCHADLTAR